MSKGGKSGQGVFDLDRIRQIVELMEQHDLTAVDLQTGDDKIKLSRGTPPGAAVPVAPAMMAAPAAAPVAGVPAAGVPTGAAPAAAADAHEGSVVIKSPMVGTFYARPNPDSANFVEVGAMVNDDTIVCIVEAMKVFNEIPAECRGKIVEVLVEDGAAVDFEKPLFRVMPS